MFKTKPPNNVFPGGVRDRERERERVSERERLQLFTLLNEREGGTLDREDREIGRNKEQRETEK